jgi:hypothetical protein
VRGVRHIEERYTIKKVNLLTKLLNTINNGIQRFDEQIYGNKVTNEKYTLIVKKEVLYIFHLISCLYGAK